MKLLHIRNGYRKNFSGVIHTGLLEVHHVLIWFKNLWYIAGIKVFDKIIEDQRLDFLIKKAMPLRTLPLCLSCLVALHNL
jgi:hypothetical protein